MNGNFVWPQGSSAFERKYSAKGMADTLTAQKDALNPNRTAEKHANLMARLLLNGKIRKKRLIGLRRKRQTSEEEGQDGSDVTTTQGQGARLKGDSESVVTEMRLNEVKVTEASESLSETVDASQQNLTKTGTSEDSIEHSLRGSDVSISSCCACDQSHRKCD